VGSGLPLPPHPMSAYFNSNEVRSQP
jgi:hypothetical protein